jgi:NADH-quinone oxidoreductase subunit C
MKQSFYIPTQENDTLLLSIIDLIKNNFASDILEVKIENKEATIFINQLNILKFFLFLRDNKFTSFKQLIDITAIDYISQKPRFSIVYNLLSLVNNIRLKIIINVNEFEGIKSISSIYTSADWLEREVYDMFGIYFTNHPNLKRLLNDFGFEGYPLRKDFPLTGYSEVFYNNETSKVEYKKLELPQAYRSFNYKNPWMENIEAETFAKINKENKS